MNLIELSFFCTHKKDKIREMGQHNILLIKNGMTYNSNIGYNLNVKCDIRSNFLNKMRTKELVTRFFCFFVFVFFSKRYKQKHARRL